MPKIGTRLRELRRRRNLGVREVALRSGISHSSISLIERDCMSPWVDTLSAILDALGHHADGFLLRPEFRRAPLTILPGERMGRNRQGADVSYRMIGMNHPNRQLLMLHETYAAGADTGEPFAHPAQEAGT